MKKPSLPRNVWVMTVASFLTDVSSDMVNNLVPLFLANALGAVDQPVVIEVLEGGADGHLALAVHRERLA